MSLSRTEFRGSMFFSNCLWEHFVCRMDGPSLPLACHMVLLELVARQV